MEINRKNVMKKILSVSMSTVMLLSVGAVSAGSLFLPSITVSAVETYGDFEYEVNEDDTVTITNT